LIQAYRSVSKTEPERSAWVPQEKGFTGRAHYVRRMRIVW
jgi:hypothetical protein